MSKAQQSVARAMETCQGHGSSCVLCVTGWSDMPIPFPPYFPLNFVQTLSQNESPLDALVILYEDTASGSGQNNFWRAKIKNIISTVALGRNWGSGSAWHWGGHNKTLDNNHCSWLGTANVYERGQMKEAKDTSAEEEISWKGQS